MTVAQCRTEEQLDLVDWQIIHRYRNGRAQLRGRNLTAVTDMAVRLGWRVGLWEADSPRMRWLVKEASRVLAADEPLEAAAAWLASPPMAPGVSSGPRKNPSSA